MSDLANIFALFAPQPATKAGGTPSAPVATVANGVPADSNFAAQLATQQNAGVVAPVAGTVPGQEIINAAGALPVSPILADADRVDGAAGPVDPVGQFEPPISVIPGQTPDVTARTIAPEEPQARIAPEELIRQAGVAAKPDEAGLVAKTAGANLPIQETRTQLAGNSTPITTPPPPDQPVTRPVSPQTAVPINVLPTETQEQIAPSIVAAAVKTVKPEPGQTAQASQTAQTPQTPRAVLVQQVPTSTDPAVNPDAERVAAERQLRQPPTAGAQIDARSVKAPDAPEQITIATTLVDRPRDIARDQLRSRPVTNAANSTAPTNAVTQPSAGSSGQIIQAPVLTALLASEFASGQAARPQAPQPSLPTGLPTGAPVIGGDAFGTENFQTLMNASSPLATTAAEAATVQQRLGMTASTKPISRVATEHVAVNIAGAVRGGLSQITIQMRPVSLGEVDVDIKISNDGNVKAHVIAERPETLEMLQRDARGLERALQDAGLKTDSGGLSFGLRGDGRGGAAPEQQQPIVPQFALPTEEPEVDLAGAYTSSLSDGGRVDIRV